MFELPSVSNHKSDGAVHVKFYDSKWEILLCRVFEVWESFSTGSVDEFWQGVYTQFLNTVGSHNVFTFATWVLEHDNLRECLFTVEEHEIVKSLPSVQTFESMTEATKWCLANEDKRKYVSRIIYDESNHDLTESTGGYLASIFLGGKYDKDCNEIQKLNLAASVFLHCTIKNYKVNTYMQVRQLVSDIRMLDRTISDDNLESIIIVVCLANVFKDVCEKELDAKI